MGMLWRDQVAYLFFWLPGTPIQESFGRTALFPATQSSIGLVLLAQKNNEDVLGIISEDNIPGFNSSSELLEELEKIRQNDYAKAFYNKNDSYAVKIGHPAYAAIAIAGRINDDEVDHIIERLNETVRDIENQQ
jgi:DNA-binding IclR family transcriptional regulator